MQKLISLTLNESTLGNNKIHDFKINVQLLKKLIEKKSQKIIYEKERLRTELTKINDQINKNFGSIAVHGKCSWQRLSLKNP